jgi:DNA end-binding protein Ku
MANLLIGSMETEWEPERYHDTHRAKVEALIEEKSQGKTIAVAKSAPAAKVIDLMDALNASIKASTGTRSSSAKRTTPAKSVPAKATAAKKTTAKKAAKVPAARPARRKAS